MKIKKIVPLAEMLNKIKEVYSLNQSQLACELGVTPQTINLWLNGGRTNGANYQNIKELYELTLDDVNETNTTVKDKPVLRAKDFDIFDDMRRIHYSKRLKDVFGMKVSNILTSFNFWVKYNMERGTHFYDGYYWCETTVDKAYSYWFRYSFNSKEIYTKAINELIENGLLIQKTVRATKGVISVWRVDKERLTKLYYANLNNEVSK